MCWQPRRSGCVARQFGDHCTYLAPYDVLMYAGSAVPNKSVISVDQFPELKPLSENWETIRDEAVRLFDEGFMTAINRWVKEWNRNVYYTLKYSLTALILGLVVMPALR